MTKNEEKKSSCADANGKLSKPALEPDSVKLSTAWLTHLLLHSNCAIVLTEYLQHTYLSRHSPNPCRMHITLAHLPIDILRLILDDHRSSYAITLYKCGNSLLNTKICNTITVVKLKSAGIELSRFPRVLTKLPHLRVLSISSRYKLMTDASNWPLVTCHLSSKLETLEIDSPDSHLALLNLVPQSSAANKVSSTYSRGKSHLIDMERYMPNLRSLTLNTRPSEKSISSIEPSDFPGLPSSLTSLNILLVISYSPESPDAISLLPPNLTDLGGRVSINSEALDIANRDWSRAPPSLTSIGLVDGPSQFSWLPQTTMKFQKVGCPSLPADRYIESLPSTLVEMKLIDYVGMTDWAEALPRNVQTLILDTDRSCPILDRNVVNLPPSLTRLVDKYHCTYWNEIRSVWDEHHRSNGAVSFWPPLEELYFTSVYSRLEDLHILPYTLRRLTIGLEVQKDDSELILDMQLFPPRLTSLSLTLRYSVQSYKIINVPVSLTDLQIYLAPWNSASTLERRMFESLPDTLTSLHLPETAIQNSNNKDEAPCKLPKSLVSLKLQQWPQAWLFALPRTLTLLSLDFISGFDSKCSAVINGDGLADLPPGLVSLVIASPTTKNSTAHVPPQRLSHLYQLRTFKGVGLGLFPSSMLRNLPSSLRIVNLNFDEIDPADAPFISPRLRELGIGFKPRFPFEAKVPAAMAPYWPLNARLSKGTDNDVVSMIEHRRAQLE